VVHEVILDALSIITHKIRHWVGHKVILDALYLITHWTGDWEDQKVSLHAVENFPCPLTRNQTPVTYIAFTEFTTSII
jgi:hypothetical protein